MTIKAKDELKRLEKVETIIERCMAQIEKALKARRARRGVKRRRRKSKKAPRG